MKSIVLVENKIDQLPVPVTGNEIRPSNFVSECRVAAYCQANNLHFVRTSAKNNATCFKWQGQKIESVVNQLVLNVHATQLAREKANLAGEKKKYKRSKQESIPIGIAKEIDSEHSKSECCY